MKGKKRCKLHGGMSPGAPRGEKNGNYRNGLYTKEAVEMRRHVNALGKWAREIRAELS